MVWLSEEPFDYAEEVDGVIIHFSAAEKPGLLEIQGAKDFLVGSLTSLVKGEVVKLP